MAAYYHTVGALGDSIFTQDRFDGSNYGYAPIEKSDMVLFPIRTGAVIDPFAEIPTLSMTGDVCVIGTDETSPSISIRETWRCGPQSI